MANNGDGGDGGGGGGGGVSKYRARRYAARFECTRANRGDSLIRYALAVSRENAIVTQPFRDNLL